MPKLKQIELLQRRFKTTATGKLKRNKALQEPYLNKEVY